MARSNKRFIKTDYRALLRAMVVVSAVVVMVGGATFAVLQSQDAKLQGNTIQTATANLSISTDGTNYSTAQNGFDFNNLIPGGPAEPVNGYQVYLKNGGGVALALKLAITDMPANPANLNLSKVHAVVSSENGASIQSIPLQSLIDSAATGGVSITAPTTLAASGGIAHYRLKIAMDADALNGSSASLTNLDFAFKGVAATN